MPISAPKIPDGLPELMRGLAKSVIKENPENLYVHAAEYFENLIRERDGHLDQGYQTFNAYQVYADYKEKTREKLGLTKDPSLSDGIGGDGDESGSGGSESKVRGRKRRRARKPSSRERENPVTMMGNPSVSDEGEPPKLKSLSEDSAPVPVVEQEIVKVHYNPPEATPSPGRVVSAQSVEAEQAVSSILDDGQILDSDGTGGKDTGDEMADNGDDIGTAPSTAEITERAVPVDAEPITAMALQDMETCFMHANVDDLLEKHPEDQPAPEANDAGSVADETTATTAMEGEDIPEGPQIEEHTNVDVAEEDQTLEVKNLVKDNDENQLEQASVEPLPTEVDEITSTPTKTVENVVEAVADEIENKETEGQDDIQSIKDAEEIVSSSNEVAVEEANTDTVQPKPENDNLKDEIDTQVDEEKDEEKIVSAEITNPDEPVSSSPDKNVEQTPTPAETGNNEVETVLEETNEQSATDTLTDAPVISSRMGFEEDVSGGGNDENENALLTVTASDTENVEPNVELPVQEPNEANEINVIDPEVDETQLKDECVKDEGRETANKIDDIILSSPDNADQLNDNDIATENAQSKPPEDAPSESTVLIDEATFEETQEQTKSALDDNVEDIQIEENKIEGETNTQNEPETVNEMETAINITPESAGDAVNVVSTKENIELVKPNEDDSETVLEEPIDTKNSEVSSALEADPEVDRDAEQQKEILESGSDKNDDLKSPNEDKNENSDSQSNDQEVNENNNQTDQNDLLTKDRSLEDVAHVEVAVSDSATDAVVTSADLLAEASAPTVPAESVEDDLHTSSVEPTEGPVTNQNDGTEVQTNEIQQQKSDEVKVEDASNSDANPTATEPTVEGLAMDAVSSLENVVIDEMQKLLQEDEKVEDPANPDSAPDDENNAASSNKDVADTVDDINESKADEKDATLSSVPKEEQPDGTAGMPSETSPDASSEKPITENDQPADVGQSINESPSNDAAIEPKDDTLVAPAEVPTVVPPKHNESLEEVVEEPCVKREISPSKSVRLEKDDSTEKQVEELEEIKKVDLSQLSKDSAEALFYTLKKSELENQEPDSGTVGDEEKAAVVESAQQQTTEDDDQDVVVKEEPQPSPGEDRTKRSFTDDFLDETPITGTETVASVPSDGVDQNDPLAIGQDRSSLEADEQKDEFNPMVMVSMRSKQYQEQLHSGGVGEKIDQAIVNEGTPKRPMMRRCMTEMSGLQLYDAGMEDDAVDTRQEDPSYVEEEDQFDGYYIGHIKNKILASSVSVADSDCPDGTRSSIESVDENNVRTALETIASTDTESTIASQATIQQAGRRSYLRKHSQNTSSNIPYASFGNAAIDQSLDEFIEREEQHKQDEAFAEAATKIQRSYRTHKKKLLRDYHSTMRTFTEDQSAESGEEYAANVIQIKLDQRRAEADPTMGDAGEESDTTTPGKVGLGATGKRPMYSLNIDEYDTVARRMTLTRGVAMQRNSTPDDDSGKSTNVSTDRKPSQSSPNVKDSTTPASGSGESPSSEEKPAGPDTTDRSSSDEPEQKDALSSSRSKPDSGPPVAGSGRKQCTNAEQVPRMVTSRTTFAPLDVQNLLLIARQRTMPVQIDSSVIRVLPKHMRKRISSAGMLNTNGKRK